jgi:hypothetical protein
MGEFRGFVAYPDIQAAKEKTIADDLMIAKAPNNPRGAPYAQHIQPAKTGAAEDIAGLEPAFPSATAWRTKSAGSPGQSFELIGSIGNNNVDLTIPALKHPRHKALRAPRHAAKKPLPPPINILQLVKKVIPPKRSFAPPAPRPVLPGNAAAASASASGEASPTNPLFFRNESRGLAARPGAAHDAAHDAAAAGRGIGLRAEFAAFGRQVMAGWRREVATMRAAAPGRGAGHAPAWGAGAAVASGGVNGSFPLGVNATMRSLRAAGAPKRRSGQSGLADVSFAPRGWAGVSQAAVGNRHSVTAIGAPATSFMPGLAHTTAHAPVKLRFAAGAPGAEAGAGHVTGPHSGTVNPLCETDLADALRTYFFRQSRMPLSSMTGFDPRVSPAWAGLPMPG